MGELADPCLLACCTLSNLVLDINECSDGNHTCHVNATCTNTEGSHECHCNSGFKGNGSYCTGMSFYWT